MHSCARVSKKESETEGEKSGDKKKGEVEAEKLMQSVA